MPILKSANPFSKLLQRWQQQHPDVAPEYYGAVVNASNSSIDDEGDYGTVDVDPRPPFVIEDEHGWQR